MKNKLFVIAIATSATLAALTGRANDSKPAPSPAETSSPAEPAGKAANVAADWSIDYESALKQARAAHKSVLLDFTGSDWCGWCMKLDREILSTPDFKRFADRHLVLVKIDFPIHRAQSNAEKARNEELAARYGVRGFPTLVLLDGEARPCGTLGYMRGGPEAFIDQLKSLIASQP